MDVALDGRFLVFTVACCALAGLVSGVLPALHASRGAPSAALLAAARVGESRSARRLRRVLVVAQISLALLLLSLGGLATDGLDRLLRADLGFDPAAC